MKQETLSRSGTAVLLAMAGLAAWTVLLLPLMPEPDPAVLSTLLPDVAASAAPEPGEMILYALNCLAAIPFSWAAWMLAAKIPLPGQRLLSCILLAGMTLYCFAPDGWMQLFHPLPWYGVIPAAVFAGACCLWKRDRTHGGRDWPAAVTVMGTLLIVIACCRIHVPARMDDNFDHHIDILLYAFNAAGHGLREVHLYGFHPLFLKPLFAGGCSMLQTSLILNGLFIAAFWCFWTAGRKTMRSRILQILFGISAVMICGSGYFFERFGWMRIDPYFVYWPIRFLFPACCLAWVWRLRPTPWCAALTAAAALWFNPETGIAVSGAFFVMYLLTGEWRKTGLFCITYLAALPLWTFLLYCISGIWPDWSGYLHYMQPYRQAGCMMLPLPVCGRHAWYFMAAVLLAALLRGMVRRRTANGGRLIFTAVLGAGIFTYYIGRSHPANLLSVSYPVLMLVFIAGDRILQLVFRRKLSCGWLTAVFPALVIGIGALLLPLVQYRQTLLGLRYTLESLSAPSRTDAECMAVRQLAGEDRTVNIWPLRHQGIFYAENGLKPGIVRFSLVEMVTLQDRERLMRELCRAECPLIVTGHAALPPELAPHYVLTAEVPEYGVRRYTPKKIFLPRR